MDKLEQIASKGITEENFFERVKSVAQTLKGNLIDRDTNFGMNESYRAALEDMVDLLCPFTKSIKEG